MVLGGSRAVLRGLGWLLAGPGLVPGWARRRRNYEGSETPYLFIVLIFVSLFVFSVSLFDDLLYVVWAVLINCSGLGVFLLLESTEIGAQRAAQVVPAYCRPSGLGNTAGAEILEGDVWRAFKSIPDVADP